MKDYVTCEGRNYRLGANGVLRHFWKGCKHLELEVKRNRESRCREPIGSGADERPAFMELCFYSIGAERASASDEVLNE